MEDDVRALLAQHLRRGHREVTRDHAIGLGVRFGELRDAETPVGDVDVAQRAAMRAHVEKVVDVHLADARVLAPGARARQLARQRTAREGDDLADARLRQALPQDLTARRARASPECNAQRALVLHRAHGARSRRNRHTRVELSLLFQRHKAGNRRLHPGWSARGRSCAHDCAKPCASPGLRARRHCRLSA
jgi:hypothetical protein